MNYKSHPLFDESAAADWIPIYGNEVIAESDAEEDPVFSFIADHLPECTELGLERLRKHIPLDWLTECPNPHEIDTCFAPDPSGSVRLYLEFGFRPSTTENSYHTDSWWIILLCPYPKDPPFGRKVEWVTEHLGWTVG